MRLIYQGFRFYRASLARSLITFPPRLLSLFSLRQSEAPSLPYWYREHTAKDRLPVLLIHGISIGIYAYVDLLAELSSRNEKQPDDGDIGIIALEITSISAHISPQAVTTEALLSGIQNILAAHGWHDFVLVGHS